MPIKSEVADDVKNSRALDGCICEESTELIRTERERGEAKSYTDHTVKHSFHRHLLSFLTDDDAITNLLPSFRLYSRLTILQGGSNCQIDVLNVVWTAELAIMGSTNSV
ncbi:hypothetical protein YC2023_020685 [Brassica napus]